MYAVVVVWTQASAKAIRMILKKMSTNSVFYFRTHARKSNLFKFQKPIPFVARKLRLLLA